MILISVDLFVLFLLIRVVICLFLRCSVLEWRVRIVLKDLEMLVSFSVVVLVGCEWGGI